MRLAENLKSKNYKDILRGLTDILYYPAFAFCFTWVFLSDSTMFSKVMTDAFKGQMTQAYHLVVIAALFCALQAMLAQDSVRLAVFETALLITGFLSYRIGGHKYSYFVLCVLIVGATGRSFKNILAISFSLGCLVMAAAYAGCRLGIIEDLVYRGGRHSYGMVYCTDCAAHILFLMLSYAMLRLPNFRKADFAVLFFGVFYMWKTGGKTNMICAFLLIALLIFRSLLRRELLCRLPRRRRFRMAGRAVLAPLCFSFPACAVFSFAAALLIPADSQAIKPLGHTIAKRLELSLRALQEHPFSFFGTKIKEYSFGGRTTDLPGWDKYFFIDCSYIRFYLFGGALLFVLLLTVFTCAQVRCFLTGRYTCVAILLIAALVCIMEHHLLDFCFDVFPLMAFSGRDFFARKKASPSGQTRKPAASLGKGPAESLKNLPARSLGDMNPG